MSRREMDEAWDDRDWDDVEEDPEDVPDEDDEPTIPCPCCGARVHEDSQRCPACEQYISREDAPPRKPWWVIVGVLACLYAVYRWMFR
jgi:hypothetical protein